MDPHRSPFLDIARADWAPLGAWDVPPLTPGEVARLSGHNESLSMREVEEVYLPVARLIRLRIHAMRRLARAQAEFLSQAHAPVPFLIGLAGSVAVGKSTTARVLQTLLGRGPVPLRIERVTTDGFLYPNAKLERMGAMRRKGFPESYDTGALLAFVHALKSGADPVLAPVYSHQRYDVLPDEVAVLERPDVVVIEGLNVLQTGTEAVFVSDYFDFAIYVDADEADLRTWYVRRFLDFRDTAFRDPGAYFHRYAALTEDEAVQTALSFWTGINQVNLEQNIQPTRERADLILEKGPDHGVRRVRLRRA